MFKFHKEPGFDLKNLGASKGLKEHSIGVVETVTTAVNMLTDLEKLVPVLVDLGKRHEKYGVVAAYYDVVGGAFLATLEQGLGDGYTDEVKEVFTKMWGVVATVM